MLPKVGVNLVPVAHGRLTEAARLAEQLGFESAWMGEHFITPTDMTTFKYPGAKLPFEPGSPFLDPIVAMTHIAAVTTELRIGTGIVVLPARDPFITARELATLDVLSGGRIEFGVGLGWMPEEYQTLGRDWPSRGRRLEEMIEIMTGLFTGDPFEFHSDHYDAPPMTFGPVPTQRPRPKMHLGGHTPKALARCARLADGWYGGSAALTNMGAFVTQLRELRAEAGRADAPFEHSIVVLHEPPAEQLHELQAAGLDRIVITPWINDGEPAFPGARSDLDQLSALAERIGLSAGQPAPS